MRRLAHAGRARFLFRLLLFGSGSFLAVLMAEVLCALLGPSVFVKHDILGRILRTPGVAHRRLEGESGTTWDLAPGAAGQTRLLDDYDFRWSVNSLGLRGPEPGVPKAAFRILVLGDSQTFGAGIDQTSTFCARLQELLAGDGCPVEVWNGGVPGYGTVESLEKLERVGPALRPDLVLAVCHLDHALVTDEGNDLWNNHSRWNRTEPTVPTGHPPTGPSRPPGGVGWWLRLKTFLAERSHLYGKLSGLRARWSGQTHLDRIRSYQADARHGPELDGVWARTVETLRRIDSVARSHGASGALVVHLPGLSSLMLDDRRPIDRLGQADLPLLSLHDPLMQEAGGDWYRIRFPHDGHYSVRAHERIARELAAGLATSGYLPCSPGTSPGTAPGRSDQLTGS